MSGECNLAQRNTHTNRKTSTSQENERCNIKLVSQVYYMSKGIYEYILKHYNTHESSEKKSKANVIHESKGERD